jgi:hypothetical protein
MMFDGMSLETIGPEVVEVTLRVPEQMFTYGYLKSDWEAAVAGLAGESVGNLTDCWRSNVDPDTELYGPDGQQVPLW